ncbi:MAG: hypothetical protein ACTXOO_01425 [Sodalis sp. (in: enterobacteria)]
MLTRECRLHRLVETAWRESESKNILISDSALRRQTNVTTIL